MHPVSNGGTDPEEMNDTTEKRGEELLVDATKLFSEELDDSRVFNIADTLEMRENLQRQLQEIMSATKMTTGRRTSVRLSRMGSGSADSGPNTPEMSRVGRSKGYGNLTDYFKRAAAAVKLFHFCQEEKKEGKQTPRFQLSSLSPQERIDYSHLIEELAVTTVQGAFSGWTVMLNIDQSRESGFRRLLQSGGAKVLPSPSPSLYREATHLFADFSRLKPGDFRVDIAEATVQGRNPPVGGWHLRTEPPRTAVSSPVAAEEGKEGCCFTSGYIYGVSIERGKVGSHVRESGEGRRPAHLVQAGRDTRTQTRSVALLASPLSVYYRRGRATCAPGCEVRQSGFSDASFSDTPSTRRFGAPCVIGKHLHLIPLPHPPLCSLFIHSSVNI
ncbi:hypothetical protein XENOCAPTIV_003154 [Xenoophorus captivus]|uniref:Uncharacterized protein n=1 Tax=Xenoophorus captivus TaxID=1517983 RepID=A0ABV0R2Y3_9TELE